jgi:hypothetical protein
MEQNLPVRHIVPFLSMFSYYDYSVVMIVSLYASWIPHADGPSEGLAQSITKDCIASAKAASIADSLGGSPQHGLVSYYQMCCGKSC